MPGAVTWGSVRAAQSRRGLERRSPGRLGPHLHRQPPGPGVDDPARAGRAAGPNPGRPAAAGNSRTAPPGHGTRLPLDHGGESRLRRHPRTWSGEPRPRPARQALPSGGGGDADPPVSGSAGGDGCQRRGVDYRGGPSVDFCVGRALLAAAAEPIDKTFGHRHEASCGGGGGRSAWAWVPSPATGMVWLAATRGSPTESCRLRRAAQDPWRVRDAGCARACDPGIWWSRRTAGRATCL